MFNKVIAETTAPVPEIKAHVPERRLPIIFGPSTQPIHFITRAGGEIGFNVQEYMMLRDLFAHDKQDVVLHYITRQKYQSNPETDKLWIKANRTGSDYKNESNYPWADIINEMKHVEGNVWDMVASSKYGGHSVPLNVYFEPDRNDGLTSIQNIIKGNPGSPVMLLDATGQVDHNSETQSPAMYKQYKQLLSFISAPAKGRTDRYIPHTLSGVNIGSAESAPYWLNLLNGLKPTKPEVIHTGSCTTHGGTVLIHALNKNIPGFKIINGNINVTHSRTPSDEEDNLDLNLIAGTTGFSAAGVKVTHTVGLANMAAVSTRANTGGASYYSLQLNVEADGNEPLTAAKVLEILAKEANGSMKEQIGILGENITKDKKKGGLHSKKDNPIASSLGLKGMLPTAMVDPNQVQVFRDPAMPNRYNIVLNVVYYDNVGGFTYALLNEMSQVADNRWDLAAPFFPSSVWDYSRAFSFFNNHSEKSDMMFQQGGNPLSIAQRWRDTGSLLTTQPSF